MREQCWAPPPQNLPFCELREQGSQQILELSHPVMDVNFLSDNFISQEGEALKAEHPPWDETELVRKADLT